MPWQRHTGRLVPSQDEGATHAMERVVRVPEHEGAVKVMSTSITTQKPRGDHIWV